MDTLDDFIARRGFDREEIHREALKLIAECRTYELWRGLDEVIRDYLDKITLADLARPAQTGDHYVI